MREHKTTNQRRLGFTLIELGIVIAIIGILISLILVAGADGVRRAEERQTQATITKVEAALIDRVDALLAITAPVNQTHRYLAAITYLDGSNHDPIASSIERRAQVIAQFDFMKAELPDVFYPNNVNQTSTINDAAYPINFAMPPYPLNATGRDAYALPLGNRQPGLPYTQASATPPTPSYIPTPGFDPGSGYNDLPAGLPYVPPGLVVVQDTGIYGASFTAAAALYKNLYEAAAQDLKSDPANAGNTYTVNTKLGYDSTDNGGLFGYVDDINEVTVTPAATQTFASYVNARLNKHDHRTARAEMLYALLVEGQGPLGSAFNASDFTNREVADTDSDGMPEFIDAWGQPLQFYRWPIFYGYKTVTTASSSDSQQGFQAYSSAQRRQLDPLDPNQLLTSVAWWGATNAYFPSMVNPAPVPTVPPLPTTALMPSAQASTFMFHFQLIIDPLTPAKINAGQQLWDRTGSSRRRSYYSKFLVLSGGPDQEIGVFRLNKNYQVDIDSSYSPAVAFPSGNSVTDALDVILCENQAAQVEYAGRTGTFLEDVYPALYSSTSTYLQTIAGLDDISNHALSAPGTGAK